MKITSIRIKEIASCSLGENCIECHLNNSAKEERLIDKDLVRELKLHVRCPQSGCDWDNHFKVMVGDEKEGDAEGQCHSCGTTLAFHWEK